MADILQQWHEQIADELVRAREELQEARREFAASLEFAREARRAMTDLSLRITTHDARMPLASVIQRRLSDQQSEARRALGAATRCESVVTVLVDKIKDLETALEQLDAMRPQPADVA